MSRDVLAQLWEEHQRAPFPNLDDPDLKADLAEYDGHLAGLISHVVGRGRDLPCPIELDQALEDRVRETGSREALDYVSQLHRTASLAREVHEAGT